MLRLHLKPPCRRFILLDGQKSGRIRPNVVYPFLPTCSNRTTTRFLPKRLISAPFFTSSTCINILGSKAYSPRLLLTHLLQVRFHLHPTRILCRALRRIFRLGGVGIFRFGSMGIVRFGGVRIFCFGNVGVYERLELQEFNFEANGFLWFGSLVLFVQEAYDSGEVFHDIGATLERTLGNNLIAVVVDMVPRYFHWNDNRPLKSL